MTESGWIDHSRAGEDIPRADEGIWHDDDCNGGGACDGCGWIDVNLSWWAGPCPPNERQFQRERAEGIPPAVPRGKK